MASQPKRINLDLELTRIDKSFSEFRATQDKHSTILSTLDSRQDRLARLSGIQEEQITKILEDYDRLMKKVQDLEETQNKLLDSQYQTDSILNSWKDKKGKGGRPYMMATEASIRSKTLDELVSLDNTLKTRLSALKKELEEKTKYKQWVRDELDKRRSQSLNIPSD